MTVVTTRKVISWIHPHQDWRNIYIYIIWLYSPINTSDNALVKPHYLNPIMGQVSHWDIGLYTIWTEAVSGVAVSSAAAHYVLLSRLLISPSRCRHSITQQINVPLFVITCDSPEVIMFSPCAFVCLFVCVCLCLSPCLSGRFHYEGLVPQKNILQVHCWWCLVVQVMFQALMTSLMTSKGHKVGQILKLIYLRQYLS